MSMLFTSWTVLVCAIFVGITIWAWRGARRTEFDEAARIPLEDDAPATTKHGVR